MDKSFDNEVSESASARPTRPRRKRKRKTVLGLGPRLVFVVAAGALMLAALWAFFTKIAQPYEMQHQEAKQISALKTHLDVMAASNADYESKIAYLQRPDGIENAARAQDWTKPGEISLEISVAPATARPNQNQSGFAGMIKNAWHNLTTRS